MDNLQIVLLYCIFAKGIESKITSGHVNTPEKWKFLDRFCFLSLDGLFKYEITYDPKQGTPSLLMYPDLQWDDAYRNPNATTCEARNKALIPEKRQILHLEVDSEEAGCENVHYPKFKRRDVGNPPESQMKNETLGKYDTMVVCRNARSFATVRERWWFIAISNCDGPKGLDVSYNFRMTNGKPGDYWYEHFSADEFYILPTLTSFCFIYLFLLFCALIFAVELKCRQLFHVTYKLFLTSLGFQNIGIILLCISYGRYGSTGEELPNVKLIGRIFEALCEFVFLLLLLLLAKGFTITRGRLRLASSIKLTVFICSYFVLYALLFFYEQHFFDSGLVTYIYESPAGYGLLVLKLVGWLMFCYAIFFTLKHFPEKSPFYLPFFAIYSLWFIAGPIIIIISNHAIDNWVREKVSVIVEHFVMFIGHIVFLFLTRPSSANKSFPYHVRTTQVGADLSSSMEPLDRFDSHSYAPSCVDGMGRTVDIFTVTGVLQRVDGGSNISGATQSPMDVFSANPGGNIPQIPAAFRIPPPKYTDVFPHEVPGQVAEMLKELDFYDSDQDSDSSSDNPRGNLPLNINPPSAPAAAPTVQNSTGHTISTSNNPSISATARAPNPFVVPNQQTTTQSKSHVPSAETAFNIH